MCSSLVRDTRAQCEEGCAVSCKCCSSTKDESCRHRDEDDAERDASCGCCSGDADVDSDDDDDDEDPSVLRKKICASAVLLVVAVVMNHAAALPLWQRRRGFCSGSWRTWAGITACWNSAPVYWILWEEPWEWTGRYCWRFFWDGRPTRR